MGINIDDSLDNRFVSESSSHGSLILVAVWGACIGWLLAYIVVYLAGNQVLPVPRFIGSTYDVKALEKLFYLSFYLLGSICAFLTTYCSRFVRNAVSAGIGALLFIAFAPHLAEAAIYGSPLAPWLILPPLALGSSFLFDRIIRPTASLPAASMPESQSADSSIADRVWAVACVLFLAACLFPTDVETVTARIGYDQHNVAFYIAPALFSLGHRLVPGVDFLPQYGIGIGYFFSFLLRPTAGSTMANAVLATAALSLFYFASALLVLRRLYNSRAYAFVVVFFALLLTFHTSMSALGVFLDPSGWPSRYPFLFLFVWLFARAVEGRRQAIDLAVAGMAAGLCMFWNTETGLYAIVSALVATLLLQGSIIVVLRNLLATACGAVVAFAAFAAIAYGPGVFQPAFISGLFKPITVYAGGLGAIPVAWYSRINLLYAVLSPLVGLATMGWSAAMILRKRTSHTRQTLIVLFLLSMLGNCLMLKWLNMSFDSLWQINALPILAVMAWWIQLGLRYLSERLSTGRFRSSVTVIKGSLLIVMLLFLSLVQDARNPALFALRAFLIYPSFLVSTFTSMPATKWDTSKEASSDDIALILRCTSPGERVMIVSDTDWVYLLAARRPPKMPWLPSTRIAAFPFLLDGAMRDAGPIFLEGDINRLKFDEALDTAIRNRIRSRGYQPGSVGKVLKVYRDKATSTSGSAHPSC